MTFYLKYRPQTVDELDLTKVRNQLSSALKSKSLPHAFLFSGPRGLGKTSAARIIAKSVNCLKLKKGEIEPCNRCEACETITKGSSMDVIEIDGASNRGIDDIRALRETVILSPLSLKKKVIVIDEVHMLTKEAFNALLKMLEEPPDHMVFILATTEPEKLPETIISRTFHVKFERANELELKRALNRVIRGEKLEVSATVLAEIINRAEGGFRDATKMLEQLSFLGKKIDDEMFTQIFPQTDIGIFINYLADKQASKCFGWIEQSNEMGISWEEILRQFLERLRVYILANYEIGTVKEKLFSDQDLYKLVDLGIKAFSRLKNSPIPSLAMEMLVLEWCGRAEDPENKNKKSEISKLEDNIDSSKIKIDNKKISIEKINETKSELLLGEDKVIEKSKIIINRKINDKINKEDSKIKFEDVNNNWKKILEYIRPNNFSLEALLKSSQPIDLQDGVLIIKVFYEFHKGRLETDKCLGTLEEAFLRILGEKPRIKYVLGEKQEREEKIKKDDEKLAETVEEIFKQ